MKVGDKVRVLENMYGGGKVSATGSIVYVTEVLDHGCQLATYPECDPDEHSDDSLFFYNGMFELVEDTFKVGDRVRLSTQGIRKWRADGWTDNESENPIFVDGTVHEIVEEGSFPYDMGLRYRVTWDNNNKNSYMEGDIEDAA